MTFDQIVLGCTPKERDKAAWFLGMLRAKQTYEALRLPPEEKAEDVKDK